MRLVDEVDARIFHFYVTTPLCGIVVVFVEDPFLLKRFRLFSGPGSRVDIPGAGPEVDIPDHMAAKRVLSNLNDFFAGCLHAPPWDLFLLEGLTPLQIKVLRFVAKIPFGSITTYGRLAKMAGVAGAARFVGTALSKNPFPLLIPCHRVIRKDGKVGGFSAGADIKRQLIEFEQKILSQQLSS